MCVNLVIYQNFTYIVGGKKIQRYTIERRQNNVLYERILRGLPSKYGPHLTFHVTVTMKIIYLYFSAWGRNVLYAVTVSHSMSNEIIRLLSDTSMKTVTK